LPSVPLRVPTPKSACPKPESLREFGHERAGAIEPIDEAVVDSKAPALDALKADALKERMRPCVGRQRIEERRLAGHISKIAA
jgi:hypothetical protein